jgi:hypothetical protein
MILKGDIKIAYELRRQDAKKNNNKNLKKIVNMMNENCRFTLFLLLKKTTKQKK